MSDIRDRDGLSREAFVVRMTRVLTGVRDIDDARERLSAYCRAGYFDHEIIAHDDECKRREVIRRSIQNMREKAACQKASQSA